MKEMYNLPPVDLLCKSEDAGVTSLNVEEMEYIKRRITLSLFMRLLRSEV